MVNFHVFGCEWLSQSCPQLMRTCLYIWINLYQRQLAWPFFPSAPCSLMSVHPTLVVHCQIIRISQKNPPPPPPHNYVKNLHETPSYQSKLHIFSKNSSPSESNLFNITKLAHIQISFVVASIIIIICRNAKKEKRRSQIWRIVFSITNMVINIMCVLKFKDDRLH